MYVYICMYSKESVNFKQTIWLKGRRMQNQVAKKKLKLTVKKKSLTRQFDEIPTKKKTTQTKVIWRKNFTEQQAKKKPAINKENLIFEEKKIIIKIKNIVNQNAVCI